ncbi:IS110 family transposase [Porifericola rhodea]|uniref:IS110 family transposase n=1 Tax=Porifericola rhodea TaxID=930972 RepID=UPI00266683C6|nr:IS110 family transposase [Porifericola rhodea]WKN31674.1 IS110 family transposase [Porifericola rhodea]
MQFSFYVGIDVSKNSLDLAVRDQQNVLFHISVENNETGVMQFETQCQNEGIDLTKSLLCCEHTGIYSQVLLTFATQRDIPFWLESSMRIKRSMGLQRGKSDKVDALRIAEYGYRHADQAVIWQPERGVLTHLKQLVALRKRFITTKHALNVPVKEAAPFQDKKLQRELQKLNQKPVEALDKQINEVEKKIRILIKEDDTLAHLFEIVTSVDGVGEVVFWEMVTSTNEFKFFRCPRKFACYSGVAPFEHSSGISIRGKMRVSHLANKQMKKLLHMAAMSAVAAEGELADYYQRKVAQGKAKMAVLNAVRNKIIHRVFACVRDNRKYKKNYAHALA